MPLCLPSKHKADALPLEPLTTGPSKRVAQGGLAEEVLRLAGVSEKELSLAGDLASLGGPCIFT